MTDVRLFQTVDGGNINFQNGNPDMAAVEVETAAYLSMFGGNHGDNGTDATKSKQYWGNLTETEPSRQYRGETAERILGSTNLATDVLDIEEHARRDLRWFLDTGLADSVEVSAFVPTYNTIDISSDITIGDTVYSFTFSQAVPP